MRDRDIAFHSIPNCTSAQPLVRPNKPTNAAYANNGRGASRPEEIANSHSRPQEAHFNVTTTLSGVSVRSNPRVLHAAQDCWR